MKKLLVLLLVLGMASAANAALWLSVGEEDVPPPASQITLAPSDTIMLTIWGDGETPSPANVFVFVEGLGVGSIAGGTILYPGNATLYDDLEELAPKMDPPMTPEEALEAFRLYTERPTIMDISNAQLIDLSATPPPLTGLLVTEIIFHCEGTGELDPPQDIFVTLFTFEAGVLDQLTIHQIPEPMTVALLGLGSLFMLRRRK